MKGKKLSEKRTFDFEIEYRWVEAYLPSKRHRKLRYRSNVETTVAHVGKVSADEAPVAFVCREYWGDEVIRACSGALYWRSKEDSRRFVESDPVTLDGLVGKVRRLALLADDCDEWRLSPGAVEDGDPRLSKRKMGCRARALAADYLIVGDEVWETCPEPRYCVMTFGLGHNHGGTSLSISYGYNGNIAASRYFSALDREAAMAEALRIAEARGDTESLGLIGSDDIEVLMPEAVKVDPARQHGDGDPFLNSLYAVTETAADPDEAALLAIAVASASVA